MHLLQIDSVNVVERAHHLTLFSRLGPYDTGLLERALERRKLFEYWARMASFAPIEDYPLYRPRMDLISRSAEKWVPGLEARRPGYVEAVYREVAEHGPLTASDLDDPGEKLGPWWGWADGKIALEYLFASGRISVAFRRNFTRYYDIVERVIPEQHLDYPELSEEETWRRLLLQASRALGVGTVADIANYFRIGINQSRAILRQLAADGELSEVSVEGWPSPVYLHPDVAVPRMARARALINPFDTFMFNRDRIERMFDFTYRIEIYVPAPKRVYGYYVFPFLLGDGLVARVDLKADRKGGVLMVPGAFLEAGADPGHVAGELAAELAEMARWLNLGDVAVGRKGDLATSLRKAV